MMFGALWEVFEFSGDMILNNNAQGEPVTLPDGQVIRPVADTMEDIICNLCGARRVRHPLRRARHKQKIARLRRPDPRFQQGGKSPHIPAAGTQTEGTCGGKQGAEESAPLRSARLWERGKGGNERCPFCNTNAKKCGKKLKSSCRSMTTPSSARAAARLRGGTGAGRIFSATGKPSKKCSGQLQDVRRLPLNPRVPLPRKTLLKGAARLAAGCALFPRFAALYERFAGNKTFDDLPSRAECCGELFGSGDSSRRISYNRRAGRKRIFSPPSPRAAYRRAAARGHRSARRIRNCRNRRAAGSCAGLPRRTPAPAPYTARRRRGGRRRGAPPPGCRTAALPPEKEQRGIFGEPLVHPGVPRLVAAHGGVPPLMRRFVREGIRQLFPLRRGRDEHQPRVLHPAVAEPRLRRGKTAVRICAEFARIPREALFQQGEAALRVCVVGIVVGDRYARTPPPSPF